MKHERSHQSNFVSQQIDRMEGAKAKKSKATNTKSRHSRSPIYKKSILPYPTTNTIDPTMTTVAATKNDENQLPSKVYQDDFSPGRGNALQAAVASVFGLDLANVPNFVVLPEGYELAIQKFCFDHGRFASLKYNLLQDALDAGVWEKYEGKLCLLRGKSPRGDFAHVVVARRTKVTDENTHISAFEMVHDPHPDETFLDKSEPFGWCIFFDDAAYEDRDKWPELIGRDCKIVETHLRETYGSKFEIQVVEQGSMVTMDFRLDRIRLYVDAETKSKVTEIPIVG